MTALADPPAAPPAEPAEPAARRRPGFLSALGRWTAAIVGALAIFGVIIMLRGANPLEVYADMITSTFLRPRPLAEVFIAFSPLALAALAVVVPARAGMSNVGGEGQVIVGAVAATGLALAFSDTLPGTALLALMAVGGALGGAAWAGLAGLLRAGFGVNEAVSTLLLNFVALDLLLFLIYQPWRADPAGQPTSGNLVEGARLPELTGTGVTVGIVFALLAAAGVFVALTWTRWGFLLSVVGGNPEAARRAGLRVSLLIFSALLVGGALAGLAGFVQFAGIEFTLRPGFAAQIGYVGFLASWLARHRPLPVLLAAFVFASLGVAADSLQLDAQLPAATVSILTALILMAVLGFTGKWRTAR